MRKSLKQRERRVKFMTDKDSISLMKDHWLKNCPACSMKAGYAVYLEYPNAFCESVEHVPDNVQSCCVRCHADERRESAIQPPFDKKLGRANPALVDVYLVAKSCLLSLDEDVHIEKRMHYVVAIQLRGDIEEENCFAWLEIRPQAGTMLINVKIDPDSVKIEEGFTRKIREIGHFGNADIEITIRTLGDLHKARALLEKSYQFVDSLSFMPSLALGERVEVKKFGDWVEGEVMSLPGENGRKRYNIKTSIGDVHPRGDQIRKLNHKSL